MLNACNQDFNWTDGVMQLYYTLSSDYQYKNPMSNVIFLDNHDLGRFLGKVNNDVGALKMMTSFLLTTRGIPQYFYGTEYLMNQTENHGVIRSDFQGGWENDFNNKFIPQGRTLRENDYFQYTQNLMQWRKTATAIHNGKLKHFIPHDGVYTYFRYNDQQTVMVIINSSKEEKTVDLSRFSEVLNDFKYGVDVQTQKKFNLDSFQMEPRSALVAEILN